MVGLSWWAVQEVDMFVGLQNGLQNVDLSVGLQEVAVRVGTQVGP